MTISEREDEALSGPVCRIGCDEERLVLLTAVNDPGIMAETRSAAEIIEDVLLKGFFAENIKAGKAPPRWLMAAVTRQLNWLRVAIQYEQPDRFADNLTSRTEADLEPRVRELRRAARKVLQYITEKSTSHKRKEKQSNEMLASLRVLGRLVTGYFDGAPPRDGPFERIARNGDGVVLSYLFEGLDLPIHLRCEDDQLLFYLKILDRHLRNGSVGDLRSSLALGKDELVACLNFIEELATNRIIRNQQRKRSRQARSDASEDRIKKSSGRPKKKRPPPQLLCAVIVNVVSRVWPEFVSSEGEAHEALWVPANGEPHTPNEDGTFESWKDWSRAARRAPKEIRQTVEDSFSSARRRYEPQAT